MRQLTRDDIPDSIMEQAKAYGDRVGETQELLDLKVRQTARGQWWVFAWTKTGAKRRKLKLTRADVVAHVLARSEPIQDDDPALMECADGA